MLWADHTLPEHSTLPNLLETTNCAYFNFSTNIYQMSQTLGVNPALAWDGLDSRSAPLSSKMFWFRQYHVKSQLSRRFLQYFQEIFVVKCIYWNIAYQFCWIVWCCICEMYFVLWYILSFQCLYVINLFSSLNKNYDEDVDYTKNVKMAKPKIWQLKNTEQVCGATNPKTNDRGSFKM